MILSVNWVQIGNFFFFLHYTWRTFILYVHISIFIIRCWQGVIWGKEIEDYQWYLSKQVFHCYNSEQLFSCQSTTGENHPCDEGSVLVVCLFLTSSIDCAFDIIWKMYSSGLFYSRARLILLTDTVYMTISQMGAFMSQRSTSTVPQQVCTSVRNTIPPEDIPSGFFCW